jgi:hypothetical protein
MERAAASAAKAIKNFVGIRELPRITAKRPKGTCKRSRIVYQTIRIAA